MGRADLDVSRTAPVRWPGTVAGLDGYQRPEAEAAALRRLQARIGETGARSPGPEPVVLGVVLPSSVQWLGPPAPSGHQAGVVWRSAVALERALERELTLMGSLLAGMASITPPDRSSWGGCFRRFEGEGSPVAAVLDSVPAWGGRRRGSEPAEELLYQLATAIRDHFRLVDSCQGGAPELDLSLWLRGRSQRVAVQAHPGSYEVRWPGAVGRVDLELSARGLVSFARREAELPELYVAGELVARGDLSNVPYLRSWF